MYMRQWEVVTQTELFGKDIDQTSLYITRVFLKKPDSSLILYSDCSLHPSERQKEAQQIVDVLNKEKVLTDAPAPLLSSSVK
jgi:hypothetical protein